MNGCPDPHRNEMPPDGLTRRAFLSCLAAGAAAPLAACSPLSLVNGWVPSDTYSATAGIAYGPQARHRLDIYLPANLRRPPSGQHEFQAHECRPLCAPPGVASPTPAQPLGAPPAPVVVFFYGGNWNSGTRADYLFVGEALAAKGWIAVVPDYRLYPEVRFPAFLDDCALAVRWTLDNIGKAGGDARQVFLMGHSAGAYNAAMLALDPQYLGAAGIDLRRIHGLIGLAGPYDFLPLVGSVTRAVFGFPDTPVTTQPIHFASPSAPPALLVTGGKDDIVDPGNSHRLALRLRAQGGQAREIVYPQLGHRTLVGALAAPFRGWAPVLDDVATFIDAV